MEKRKSETNILIENTVKDKNIKSKKWFEDENISNGNETNSFDEWCFVLPCCMDEDESSDFGHHVSVFMVGLIAFATFFCVNLILILVFLLG
uniref:G-protein coupled receptors family 1 profile domain-containing protein n=1 Tax=Strongyloides stercoralis TaxID=6248 RepID=A0A0K0EP46_STRER